MTTGEDFDASPAIFDVAEGTGAVVKIDALGGGLKLGIIGGDQVGELLRPGPSPACSTPSPDRASKDQPQRLEGALGRDPIQVQAFHFKPDLCGWSRSVRVGQRSNGNFSLPLTPELQRKQHAGVKHLIGELPGRTHQLRSDVEQDDLKRVNALEQEGALGREKGHCKVSTAFIAGTVQ
jgi:hypothetical protein